MEDNNVYVKVKLDTSGFKLGTKEMSQHVTDITNKLKGMSAKAQANCNSAANAFIKQNQAVASATAEVEKLERELADLQNKKTESSWLKKQFAEVDKDIETSTKELREFQNELGKLNKSGKGNSAGAKAAKETIERIKKDIAAQQNYKENLTNDPRAYVQADTSGVEAKLAKAKAKQSETINNASGAYEKFNNVVNESNSKLNENGNVISRISSSAKKIKTTIGNVTGSFKKFANNIKSVVNKITNGFKKLATSAKTALTGMFNKSAKASSGIKDLIKASIGISSLLVLFNKLKNFTKEGLNNLVQFDSGANASISSIVSSLENLKNALATAFAPIITVIAPILTSFVDMLSRVATQIANLFALIAGKTTFSKAKKGTTDYAKSLNGATGATKKAEKENKKYLSGLDEIATFTSDLADQNESSSGGASPLDMFETADVQMPDWFKKFKDLFDAEDWYGLGYEIAEKLADGLDQLYDLISWDNVGEKITYYCQMFIGIINGIIGNPRFWASLGSVLGALINDAIQIAWQFLTGINWVGLGKSLGIALNNAIKEIDWEKLGESIAAWFLVLPSILYGLIMETDWTLVGKSLAEAINSGVSYFLDWLDQIDLEEAGQKIATGLTEMIEDIDWDNLGKLISDFFLLLPTFLIGIIKGTNFKEVAKAVSTALKSAFNNFTAWLKEIDWQELGEKIKDFIVNIDWAGVADSLFKALGTALASLAEFIWGIIGDAWDSVVEWWKDKAFEDGEFTITGLLDGIVEALKNIGTWIKDHIFTPFINGFKDAFDIHSPSKVMQEMGDFLMQGLLNGVNALVDNFKKIWEDLKNTVVSIFNNMWDRIKGVINTILGGTEKMANGVIKGLNGAIEAINGLNFTLPDWIPLVGGKELGFKIPTLETITIPRLATGAVIPPNAPFMAQLGDQKNGTNLEAPENLIRQIMREEGGNGTYRFTAEINRKVLFDEVIAEAKLRQSAMGRNPFEFA